MKFQFVLFTVFSLDFNEMVSGVIENKVKNFGLEF